MIVTIRAAALVSANKTSFRVLFKSGLFQFTGWESYISGPSALWCHVSLLKLLHRGLLKDGKSLRGRCICCQLVEKWDYLGLEEQPNLPHVADFFSRTNPSHVFKATKTVVINASVELTLDEYSQSCSSDLHSIPLVQ